MGSILGLCIFVCFAISSCGFSSIYSKIMKKDMSGHLAILFPNPIGFTVVAFLALIGTLAATHLPMFFSPKIQYKPDGAYCYTVAISRKPKGSKQYILPAKIEVDHGDPKTYYLRNAYWSGGGYLYFEDCKLDSYGAECSAFDQNEVEWNVRLIDKPNYTMAFEETELHLSFEDIVCIIYSCGGTFSYFALMLSERMKVKDLKKTDAV